MMIVILYAGQRSRHDPVNASAPTAFESMTDDDERRARAFNIFGVIRFRLPGFSRPVILRHRLERTQEIPPIGGDLPTVAIPKRMTAGENIDCPNPSGETSHPCAPLRAARGENGNVSLE
jgi:hypothetical protein